MALRAPARLRPRHALALALAQGPTELLPVSSSAHTTLIPLLLGWPYGELDAELRKSFELALHAGAGAALALDMRRELIDAAREIDARRVGVIALSLAPAALVGLVLRPLIERRLGGLRSIAAGLLLGALAMGAADTAAADAARSQDDARALDGLALGVAQAVALVPGVSRYGATLTAARARGFARGDAQALSWHAALPVMLGASAFEGVRLARRGAPGGRSRRSRSAPPARSSRRRSARGCCAARRARCARCSRSPSTARCSPPCCWRDRDGRCAHNRSR